MTPFMTANNGLARNDIVRLHVERCAKTGSSSTNSEALELRRIEIPVDFLGTRHWDGKYHEPRRTAPSGPSSEYNVKFKLGNKLNAGASGLIYEALDPSVVNEGMQAGDVAIPPLVIKIAARTKNKNLAREAFFYDEMQTLQGVVIPRCYGWFEAQMTEDTTFIPWESDDIERSYPEDDPTGERFFIYWARGAFNESSRPLVNRLGEERTVSFILLERLGGPFLPRLESHYRKKYNEVSDAFAELSRLYIEHNDVRRANILSTLPPPDGQPSIRSSHNSRLFNCRIIDFELSRKFLQDPEELHEGMMSWVTMMLDNLPENRIIGQFQ